MKTKLKKNVWVKLQFERSEETAEGRETEENEKGVVNIETEGEAGTTAKSTFRLVKALLHTAAIFTTHTHTHVDTQAHLLSTNLIGDLLSSQTSSTRVGLHITAMNTHTCTR